MPVNNAKLAAVAKAANQAPPWNRPPNTVFGPQITDQTQEGAFHPRVDVVQRALLGPVITTADRLAILQARLLWVAQRKTAAETALTGLGLSPSLPESIDNTTPYTEDDWPLANAAIRLKQPWYRLRVGDTRPTDSKGRPIPQEEDTSTDLALAALRDTSQPPSSLAAAASDPAATAALLLQLRCLADIYIRWEVGAQLAATLVTAQLVSPPLTNAQMLARILTYFRIEGDMSLPPDEDTLEGSDQLYQGNSIPLPPGRSRFFPYQSPSAYMCCVTFLARPVPFPVYGDLSGQPLDLSKASVMTQVADRYFTLVLGGLDILFNDEMQVQAETFSTPNPGTFTYQNWQSWPALNRQIPQTVNIATAQQQALNDLTTRRGLLSSTSVGPVLPADGVQAMRTTPTGAAGQPGTFSGTAAHYAALVLSEGVRYLNRLGYGPVRFGPGTSPSLPEILVYALFHMGAEAKGMLTSAAAAAYSASTSKWGKALKAAMLAAPAWAAAPNPPNAPDPPLSIPAIFKAVTAATSTAGSVATATKYWDQLGPLLGTDTVAKALADLLRNENDSGAGWKAWSKPTVGGYYGSSPRANCIGYMQLFEYLTNQIR